MPLTPGMAQGWKSYDSIATTHDRLSVPSLFAQPAKDLAARIDLATAGRVLDVGTGTGIAGIVAKELAGPGTVVAGGAACSWAQPAPPRSQLRLPRLRGRPRP